MFQHNWHAFPAMSGQRVLALIQTPVGNKSPFAHGKILGNIGSGNISADLPASLAFSYNAADKLIISAILVKKMALAL